MCNHIGMQWIAFEFVFYSVLFSHQHTNNRKIRKTTLAGRNACDLLILTTGKCHVGSIICVEQVSRFNPKFSCTFSLFSQKNVFTCSIGYLEMVFFYIAKVWKFILYFRSNVIGKRSRNLIILFVNIEYITELPSLSKLS